MFLAYLNKFNLPVFFLRLLAYMYAKFLRSLTRNMQVMRDVYGDVAVGGADAGFLLSPGEDDAASTSTWVV